MFLSVFCGGRLFSFFIYNLGFFLFSETAPHPPHCDITAGAGPSRALSGQDVPPFGWGCAPTVPAPQ